MADKTYRLQMTEELHGAVKVAAAKSQITINSWIEEAIKFYMFCQLKEE